MYLSDGAAWLTPLSQHSANPPSCRRYNVRASAACFRLRPETEERIGDIVLQALQLPASSCAFRSPNRCRKIQKCVVQQKERQLLDNDLVVCLSFHSRYFQSAIRHGSALEELRMRVRSYSSLPCGCCR